LLFTNKCNSKTLMIKAIHKPTGISSAQVLRDCQKQFNPSKLFAPWIEAEKKERLRVNHNQRNRRRDKNVQVKIGHGGTLDPLATGVLIAGIGKGTKVLQTFLECTKQYETVVLFGASTDTYDRVGKILKKGPYAHVTKEMVEKTLEPFRGKIMQRPPLYSALKMNGKPLYEYAREGKEIPKKIEKRPVEVVELELVEFMPGGTHEHKWPTEEAGQAEKDVAEKVHQIEKEDGAVPVVASEDDVNSSKRKREEEGDDMVSDRPAAKIKTDDQDGQDPTMSGAVLEESASGETTQKEVGPPAARIRMTVTSGFYVRSLCQDLGEAVGSEAMMAELVRTRQGQFELGKNVLEYSDLEAGEEVWGPKVEAMLDTWGKEYKPFADPNRATRMETKPDADADTKKASSPADEVKVDGTAEATAEAESDIKPDVESEKKAVEADSTLVAKESSDSVQG
jgi:tRNA pseudouridine55 synthase